MFPIRDDNPQILTPYGTYAIIGANLLIWLLVQGAGQPQLLLNSLCSFGLIPARLMNLVPEGAGIGFGNGVVCVPRGTGWYTVLTSMFMHGGWLHVIGNMWFLYIFGNNVEDAMGTLRFVIFYLLCGFCAAALQIAMDPSSPVPMVGASGAIGGVMGAYIVLYPHVRVHLLLIIPFFITTFAVPAVFMLAYWILLQLVSGLMATEGDGGGVAFWAHVGGFTAGALLIFVFRNRALLARHPYHGWGTQRSPNRSWQRIKRR
jgi:membrane associated rhomboid family serine protease